MESGKDRVCDTMLFINDINSVLTILKDNSHSGEYHNIMDYIICDYIIPNYARDSDSEKEYNDYYKIIGRNESNIVYSEKTYEYFENILESDNNYIFIIIFWILIIIMFVVLFIIIKNLI